MSYFRICPICGDSLDPGERCFCLEMFNKTKEKYNHITFENPDGQLEMEMDYEANRKSLDSRTA